MELRQIKYFSVVAQTLNFSRAAELLHIAQPPLSRQIQQLEEELGVQLIDRSARPIRLTNAGTYFLDHALKILRDADDLAKSTKRIDELKKKWMGIGFVPSILYGFLPNVLRKFSSEEMDVEISLSEMTSVQQADALKSHRIDIGFGRVPIHDDELKNIVLIEEPLVVAVPSPSKWLSQDSISLPQLVDEVLVLYPATPRPSFADQILKHFSVRGYTVGSVQETNGLHTALGMVAAGVGVTIVPSSVQILRRQDIDYRPLAEDGMVTPLIMTVRKADKSSHLDRFRSFLDTVMKDMKS